MTSSSDLPSGAVTTADLYRKLGDISDTVIRMDERIKALPDIEARLRLLERFRYTLMGVAASVGMLAGVASGILSALLSRH